MCSDFAKILTFIDVRLDSKYASGESSYNTDIELFSFKIKEIESQLTNKLVSKNRKRFSQLPFISDIIQAIV